MSAAEGRYLRDWGLGRGPNVRRWWGDGAGSPASASVWYAGKKAGGTPAPLLGGGGGQAAAAGLRAAPRGGRPA